VNILKNFLMVPVSCWCLMVLKTYAETPVPEVTPKQIVQQTTYAVTDQGTTVTTLLTEDKSKSKMINSYLFPVIEKTLKKNPIVSNVVFVPGVESKTDNSWSDYITKKRESYAYVNINMNSQISLMFKVVEELRVCKANKKSKSTDQSSFDEWASPSGCGLSVLKSSVEIKGPVAVYGTYVSNINVDSLLNEKQELSFSVSTNFNEQFQIESSFKILSSSFEEGLVKFLEVFNFKTGIAQHFSRRQLLVGVSRSLRTINEGVLGL
jgi:hypothetical protein